jgi:hypothetical protein
MFSHKFDFNCSRVFSSIYFHFENSRTMNSMNNYEQLNVINIFFRCEIVEEIEKDFELLRGKFND